MGTNTIRNLHFAAPLSASLENENFTLSLACDSYSIAQTDAAIATALAPYETAAQRDAAIAAALAAYSTGGWAFWRRTSKARASQERRTWAARRSC